MVGFYSHYQGSFDWILITHVSALAIPYFFLIFALNFPRKLYSRSVSVAVSIVPVVFLDILLMFTDSIVGNTRDSVYTVGSGYLVYCLFLVLYFIAAFIFLIKQYYRTHDLIERRQVQYILIGSLIASSLAIIPDLILPYFNIFSLTWAGPVFTLIMVVSLFIAMLKYRLFNVKVILSEIISVVIVVILTVELFFASTQSELVLKTIILLIVTIFSYLLIKSVYREVSQREKIELLAADLKTANDNQVNLIHIMNHQIKGKLGDARAAFAELLTDDYGVVPESAKVIIKKGLEETETGVNYVQNILKGLSAENGTLPYEMKEIDLKELVNSVGDKMRGKAEGKSLKFEVNVADGDYKMSGDRTELGEALRNLIENSIAYTPKGSIHVWLTKKGSKALIAVQDTGVGIADEDKLKLFKSGGRGKDSIKVNVDSTGYGLSFVKGVVEAHHGRVWAESDGPGKGSSFYVEVGLV